jgi:DNA invertase Pin-like site-specific DNA recombinase
MMSEVQPGDQVVLPSISSLGPSLKEISSKWDQMVSSGADIQILDFDEVQSESFDQSSLTEIIRYLAKSERVGRKRRQRAGIEQARDSGVHLGRKKLEIPAEFPELMKRYKEGAISSRQAASRLNVTHTTFLLWVRSMDN